jgi:IclR family acetate operon transcriptional repressor
VATARRASALVPGAGASPRRSGAEERAGRLPAGRTAREGTARGEPDEEASRPSASETAGSATNQSVDRALELLTSFEDGRAELGVTEMARAIGVHKSTASRLAATLERAGFLARVGERYRLGTEIMRLGSVALRNFDVLTAMRGAMEKVAQATGETVNLAVPEGEDVLNVAEVPSSYILTSSTGWTGRRTRPHATANGKVLMAYDALPVPKRLERYTPATITTRKALGEELETVRARGYAVAVGELEDALVAVATPVFDGAGTCVAALSVSGPSSRLTPERLEVVARLCRDA